MPRKPQTKPAAEQAPKTKALEPAPDWVNDTPDEDSYSLIMYEGGGSERQGLQLTRAEFIRLKRWLAALRGYPLAAPRDSFQYQSQHPEELEQFALEITQEEIEMVQDAQRLVDVLCLNLRRRLRLGAKVEPGKWRLDETAADTIESYEEACIVYGGSCGLDFKEAREEATATARA